MFLSRVNSPNRLFDDFLECNDEYVVFHCMSVILLFVCCIMFVVLFCLTPLIFTCCTCFPFMKAPLTYHCFGLHRLLFIVGFWFTFQGCFWFVCWTYEDIQQQGFYEKFSHLLSQICFVVFMNNHFCSNLHAFMFPSWRKVVIGWLTFFWPLR